MRRFRQAYQRLAAFILWAAGSSAFAQTWNGSVSANWSNPANWTGGLPSNNGTATAVFNGNAVYGASLDANWNISTLTTSGNTFGLTNVVVTGPDTLTIQNGLTSSVGNFQFYPVSFAVPINLTTVENWNITSTSSPISYSSLKSGISITGVISGSGGIAKGGNGDLALASGNTYSGGTVIGAGSVTPTDDTSFGNSSGQLEINGGTLNLTSSTTTFGRGILLGSSGGTILPSGNLASSISGAGAILLTTASTVPPNVTLSGNSSFSGGMSVVDAAYPSYASTWLVTISGTNQSLGNGPVTLSPGTTLSINAASNIGNGYTIDLVGQSALVVTSDSFDPAQVIAPASTQAMLELGTTTYTRALNMAAYGDGTLSLGASNGQTVVYLATTLQPGAGNVYRLGGSPGTLVISGADNVLTGTASVLAGGDIDLLNSNNFTGGFTGAVSIGNDGALGSGPVTLGSLTALNGTRTLNNPVLLLSGKFAQFTGPIILNGTVDLNGGTPLVFVHGAPVVFANAISDGTLELNSGISVLQAANTFSALDLWEGSASVASESNLGGSSTPINFDGFYNQPTNSGTLETTASFTLNNPISFNRPSTNAYGTFQVDPGTTLTLNEAISGGNINKTGTGTMAFSSSSSLNGSLYVYGGNVTSAGNSLGSAVVQTNPGGTFSGSGNVGWLALEGGQVSPGGGTGTIVSQYFSISSYAGLSTLEFQFTQNGSPNYNNLVNSGNGLISFTSQTSDSIFSGNKVSIFLSTPTVQLGSLFKGAFFIQSTAQLPLNYFNGVAFAFYVPSPSGTTTFNGQTFSPLNSSLYAVQQSWIMENGGQVSQFVMVSPLGSPPVSSSLGSPYSYTFPSTGSPTFSVTSGSLPPGITLSSSGVLSGTPTSIGSYSFAITSTSSNGSNTIQDFTLNVQQDVASDSPTMPPWALMLLAVMLFVTTARGLLGKQHRNLIFLM